MCRRGAELIRGSFQQHNGRSRDNARVDLLKLADRSWPVLGPLMSAHARLYRATGGRIGRRVPGLPPMLLLEHIGARSGTRRVTPLVYMPAGDDFVLVAAKGGYPKHPAWVHNLRAHPDTEIQVGAQSIRVRAREADGDERRRVWSKAVEYNPQWGRYQRRTDRRIPVIILERRRDQEV
jgi:deazaflavin-dependent oxidoreductase (nitroreductase family)